MLDCEYCSDEPIQPMEHMVPEDLGELMTSMGLEFDTLGISSRHPVDLIAVPPSCPHLINFEKLLRELPPGCIVRTKDICDILPGGIRDLHNGGLTTIAHVHFNVRTLRDIGAPEFSDAWGFYFPKDDAVPYLPDQVVWKGMKEN